MDKAKLKKILVVDEEPDILEHIKEINNGNGVISKDKSYKIMSIIAIIISLISIGINIHRYGIKILFM
jgi:hypothetical protein